VKIRLQHQGSQPKELWRYNGSIYCYRTILTTDAITGLRIGVAPNIMRISISNAAELASYDQFKQIAVGYEVPDSLSLHIACSFAAGFNAVVVGSPVDVLKTRLMNQVVGQPTNPFKMIAWIFANEGPLAFYKGFTTNFLRIGSWNVIMFVTLEQLRMRWGGMEASKGK